MCIYVLVLACLLCTCHGLHLQMLSDPVQDSSDREQYNSPRLLQGQAGILNPLKALAVLFLAFKPVNAFNVLPAGLTRRFLKHSLSHYLARPPSAQLLRLRSRAERIQDAKRPLHHTSRLRSAALMRQNDSVDELPSAVQIDVGKSLLTEGILELEDMAERNGSKAVLEFEETDMNLSQTAFEIEKLVESGNDSRSVLDFSTLVEINRTEGILNLTQVVDTLRNDIPELLRRDPNWDIYAPDFHIKTSVEGIGVLRVLSKLLQRRKQLFVVQDAIQVNFVNGRTFAEPFDPFCVARWKVQLDRPYNDLEKSISMRDDPIVLEAETLFHLNGDNQVDYVQIDNLVVDGRKILSWPVQKIYDNPAMILDRIKDKVTDEKEIPELDDFLSLQKVVETLKADIPKLLRKEPNWEIYSNNFTVKSSREGLAILKLLASLLRRRNSKVVLSEDIEVEFNDGRWKVQKDGRPFDPYIVARWKLGLERPFNRFERGIRFVTRPFTPYYRKSSMFGIEAETIFHLNDRNKVDYVLIDELVVDGRKIFSWPRVELADDPAKILESLKTAVDAPFFEPLKKLQELAQNLKQIDLSASPVIRMWKSLAAQSKVTAENEVACEDTKTKIIKKMDGTERILTQLADDIEWATPDEILALVGKDKKSEDSLVDVSALASVTQQTLFDTTGKLAELAERLGIKEAGADLYTDGLVPVVEIGEVVAMPTAGAKCGVGKELLLQIVGRAAASGRLVVLTPANEQLESYYKNVGFEMVDDFGRTMVYSKPLEDVADNDFNFDMGSLRVS